MLTDNVFSGGTEASARDEENRVNAHADTNTHAQIYACNLLLGISDKLTLIAAPDMSKC